MQSLWVKEANAVLINSHTWKKLRTAGLDENLTCLPDLLCPTVTLFDGLFLGKFLRQGGEILTESWYKSSDCAILLSNHCELSKRMKFLFAVIYENKWRIGDLEESSTPLVRDAFWLFITQKHLKARPWNYDKILILVFKLCYLHFLLIFTFLLIVWKLYMVAIFGSFFLRTSDWRRNFKFWWFHGWEIAKIYRSSLYKK